ncbi:MFS transporter [Actinomycetospora endophytica]|uniref:MFS transporter n=1 Tax=Actinomycetospora endophytica TaxID=2291215 RepID=A0ABS8P529_9PSEU|nr:MFS transporter [Actinomycetospora endophytica]MCD2193341.1 MFS transporter [Actinomycetospora endophytica]
MTTPRRAALLTTMCVGMFLVQLDVTVVNVALPDIRAGLDTSLSGQQWVVDAYAVVLAGLLLAGGALGDRVGHRRVVIAGLLLFGAASLAGGAAPSAAVLVGARSVQGLGAALLLPGTLAVVTRAFPGRAEQARAVGIWAGVSALALPAGPLLGGALVSGPGWRWVFLVNLPIVLAAVPATLAVVGRDVPTRVHRLDLPGAALAAVTLAAAVLAVIALERGPGDPRVWAAAAVALLGLAGFMLRERRAAAPMVPPALWRTPAFVGANLVAAAMNLVGIGVVFVATLYLQTVQGHPAVVAGAMLLPLFVPLAALAPLTGRLVGRVGPRPPMTAGLALGIVGCLALVGLRPDSGYLRLLPVLLGLGVGMGLLTAAVVAAAVRAVDPERSGLASGVNNTARQSAGAIAVALFGLLAGSPTDPARFTAGLGIIGVLGAVVWALALVVSRALIAPGEGSARPSRRPRRDRSRAAGAIAAPGAGPGSR